MVGEMTLRAAVAAGSLAANACSRAWAKATRRPVDAFAILGAGTAAIVIVVNAVFLQSGSHPAPFFANPTHKIAANVMRPKPKEEPAPNAVEATAPVHAVPLPTPAPRTTTQSVSMRRNDPIAQLIGPSPRIAAVQRVLSDYGYGQIKPSGVLDEATGAAIEKFEREHKMAVTGRVSNKLVTELAALAGHSLE